jgi:glutamyl-tRNA reductase
VLVLGAGEMARVAAARLRERGVGRLILANRTWAKAQELAALLAGEALPWAWRQRVLPEVGGIVCATGAPEPVIAADWLCRAVGTHERRLVVIDLAVPRNIEAPAIMPTRLVVADVECLTRRLDDDAGRRRSAVTAALAIIGEELETWASWARIREERAVREEAAPRGSVAG